jgi:broad specificity phosphatase PhoE
LWQHLAAWLGAVAILAVVGGAAAAETLGDEALIAALRGGGYTIYFRHAATDWSRNDRIEADGDWTSCDPNKMRQLSGPGRASARRVGEAIRALQIPVGKVLSSEYCRAAATARPLGLGPVETTRAIMNMRAAEYVGGRQAVIRRARRVLSEPPPPGANVIIVGHGNLMRAATGAYTGEGGSGIYAPRAESGKGFELVARLSPDDWTRLKARFANDG